METDLSDEQKAYAKQLKNSLPLFADKCLKIKDKSGQIIPLKFNKAQLYIHERCEDQKRRLGRVRVIILKGRQQGSSTYVAARFYHKTSWKFGISTQILSHLSDTTEILYEVVERFYNNCPARLRPGIDTLNRRTMKFQDLDSQYRVGTAGSDDIGRGGTTQLFHGSEVAFWKKTDNIDTGILQAVSDMDDTEIILESTANGMGNFFYDKTTGALRKEGDFELIFVPWFWQEEYRRKLTEPFSPTDDEEALIELYGLDHEQLNWRRAKIIEFKGDKWKFHQEYPSNPTEAFQMSGESYISVQHILAARKRKLGFDDYQHAPLIMGVDCGRTSDRTTIAFRKGPKLLKVLVYDPKKEGLMTQPETAGWISSLIDKYHPQLCNIDVGEGRGTVDILHVNGYKKIVRGIYFNSKADDPVTYANKRAEIWARTRDWIECEDGDVQIPDDDAIQADLAAMPKLKDTMNSRIKMPEKTQIIKVYGRSTDIGDGIALTFAFLINKEHNLEQYKTKERKRVGGLITMKKKRGLSKQQEGMLNPGNIFAR